MSAEDYKVIESVLAHGRLEDLTPQQRVSYLLKVCHDLGLNPLTRPLEYISIGGKMQLYARRECTDQLRRLHQVSIEIVEKGTTNGVYWVRVRARAQDGRQDEATGAVPVATPCDDGLRHLPPRELAVAMMTAETKAKRRVTLSICGLGVLDESELDLVPSLEKVQHPELPAIAGQQPPPESHDDIMSNVHGMLRKANKSWKAAAIWAGAAVPSGFVEPGEILSEKDRKALHSMLSEGQLRRIQAALERSVKGDGY